MRKLLFYKKVVEIIQMIFESPCGHPTLEELVLCDLFRNIDLREMRGIFVPVRLLSFEFGFSNSISFLI